MPPEDAKTLRRQFGLRSIEVSPETFSRLANFSLVMLTLIVFTGATVRLTGSGLGCPDWPRCHGSVVPPLDTPSVIEYGNRIFSALVGFAALAAAIGARLRRPFRRDLALLALAAVAGVLAQAVLGALTVYYHLAPGFVMSHFLLSMLILVAAFALAWRANPRWSAEAREGTSLDRGFARWLWGLGALGAIVITMGTITTAAGPHAGGAGTDDPVERLQLPWLGAETLDWMIHQHGRLATLFGLATLAAWWLARRRGSGIPLVRALTVLAVLLGLQGVVGLLQFELGVPSELVWLHVALATVTWLALLWVLAVTGRPSTRPAV